MSPSLEELRAELVARGWAVESESEPVSTDMGEELICLQCEFEAESIEHMAEHMRETPGH
jgi:hypothetical protein